ncbi:MAG: hypothetical protein AAF404_21635, partial [Pseudomonadota bacterium]
NVSLWKTLAVFALLGWVVTAASWLVLSQRRRRSTSHRQSTANALPSALLRELQKAAEQQDRPLFRERLMAWAHQQWAGEHFRGPQDVAARLPDAELSRALEQFEASLYSGSSTVVDTVSIFRLLKTALDNANEKLTTDDYLPSL